MLSAPTTLLSVLSVLLPTVGEPTPTPHFSPPIWMISARSDQPDLVRVPGVGIELSNNNLAIAIHRGRLYFAFRTATHHHPKPPIWSPQYARPGVRKAISRLYVVSAPVDKDVGADPSSLAHLEWRLEFELLARLTKEVFEPRSRALLFGTEEERDDARQWFVATFGEDGASGILQAARVATGDDDERWSSFRERTWGQLWEPDLREPLFLPIAGQLHFYGMQIEGRSMSFRAQAAWRLSLPDSGDRWSTPAPILEPGEHFWETQIIPENGRSIAYLTSTGSSHYGVAGMAPQAFVRFRRSTDGVSWRSVQERGFVDRGGAGEPAFVFDPHGRSLWSVLRLERGDDRGWGSLVGKADAPSGESWDLPLRGDPRKYDSARMFAHAGGVYLIARQNVGRDASGRLLEDRNWPFDRAFEGRSPDAGVRERESILRRVRNDELALLSPNVLQAFRQGASVETIGVAGEYARHYYFDLPKRTALYRLNPEDRTFTLLATMPSAGDTAFPSIQPLGGGRFLVGNYSSDPAKREWSWRDGQQNRTGVYLTVLSFQ